MPHSFGDQDCQDAFIGVQFQHSDQLAPEAKTDRKISEDDLSCSAANFLATITSVCLAEVNHSHLQKIEFSTTTTASFRGASPKSVPSRSNRITGLQQLHQLASVPVATVSSLNSNCLNSQTKWALPSKPLLPTTNPTCLDPALFVVNQETPLQIALSSRLSHELLQPVGNSKVSWTVLVGQLHPSTEELSAHQQGHPQRLPALPQVNPRTH